MNLSSLIDRSLSRRSSLRPTVFGFGRCSFQETEFSYDASDPDLVIVSTNPGGLETLELGLGDIWDGIKEGGGKLFDFAGKLLKGCTPRQTTTVEVNDGKVTKITTVNECVPNP
jgi:hypothetical protein